MTREPIAYINVEKRTLEFAKNIFWHTPTVANIDRIPLFTKEALAQPEQEPVALPCCGYADSSAIKWNPYSQVVQGHNCGQVYTHPPQRTWVGLVDDEIAEIESEYIVDYRIPAGSAWNFAKDIEAKLKQKNGYAEEKT